MILITNYLVIPVPHAATNIQFPIEKHVSTKLLFILLHEVEANNNVTKLKTLLGCLIILTSFNPN